MDLSLPIRGYARDYTDAAELLADQRARKRRLWRIERTPPQRRKNLMSRDWLILDEVMITAKPDTVIDLVAEAYNVSYGEIIGDIREARIMLARKVACWLLREHCKMSYNQIAIVLRKHHSNVMWHCVDMARACQRDAGLARRMAVLCETLFVRSRHDLPKQPPG